MTSTETTPTATLPARVTPELIARLTARVRAGGDTDARAPFTLTEVYTGAAYGELPQSRPEDVAAAFATARAAQRTWAATPLKQRLAVFARAHELILTERTLIADLIQIGCGKARRMAFEESCDVPMIISHYLKTARRILKPRKHGGTVPLLSTSIEEHRPKGVIGVIAPWNFPFALALSDAVAALIAGNAVVLKPDNKTALCALFGVELFHRAGLPEGLFEVVCGEGPDIGGDLIDNSDFVMFTGSTATGRLIGERAGRNLIGCSLELGGKNPLIVLDDADLDAVIPGAVFATFANSGQACMHIERIYVHDRVYEEFLRRFVEAAAELGAKAGASYDYTPEFGSLISPDTSPGSRRTWKKRGPRARPCTPAAGPARTSARPSTSRPCSPTSPRTSRTPPPRPSDRSSPSTGSAPSRKRSTAPMPPNTDSTRACGVRIGPGRCGSRAGWRPGTSISTTVSSPATPPRQPRRAG